MWLLLLACGTQESGPGGDDSVGEANVRDLRMEFAAPPDPGLQFLSPDITVGPYEEVLICYYGVYEGEEVGVTYMAPLSVPGFTHHNQLKAVYDDSIAPGTLQACPEINNGMPVYAPLFESVGIPIEGGTAPKADENGVFNWINFPDGIAFRLKPGQRWVMDLHYVNTTGDTLIVNAAVNIGTVDPVEVDQWAGAVQFDAGTLDIPPNQESTVDFVCDFQQDLNILSLMGHMHDAGTSYTIDWVHPEGENRVYEVNNWSSAYREYPKIDSWDKDAFPVKTGEGLRTRCSWNNTSDEALAYPHEMCTSVVVMYPLDEPRSCFGGTYEN